MSVLGVTGSVTEDGVERVLAGAGVTRGSGASDAARALLRVSGGPGGAGTRGCCFGGPEGKRDTGLLRDVIVVVFFYDD